MNDKATKEYVDAVLQDLHATMSREVGVMRELLSSLVQEQTAILANNTEQLNTTLKAREPQMDALLDCRKRRCDLMRAVAHGEGPPPLIDEDLSENTLDILHTHDNPDCSGILMLRDQILELIEKLQEQTDRNSYLIRNKVAMTKEMIRRLYPGSDNNTYGKDGTVAGSKQCTVAIINREV